MVPGLLARSERYSPASYMLLLRGRPKLRSTPEGVPGRVPGMHVHSYASYDSSTTAVEYTRGGTRDECTLTTDPEEIDWCWRTHWTVWHV